MKSCLLELRTYLSQPEYTIISIQVSQYELPCLRLALLDFYLAIEFFFH